MKGGGLMRNPVAAILLLCLLVLPTDLFAQQTTTQIERTIWNCFVATAEV